MLSLLHAEVLPSFVRVHFRPIFPVIDDQPTPINRPNPSPFVISTSGIRIGLLESMKGVFTIGERDAGHVSKPWNRRFGYAFLAGHCQEGDPDDANMIRFAPDR